MKIKCGVKYLRELDAEKANDLVEWIETGLAEGWITKKEVSEKFRVNQSTMNKFINGLLNPDRP